MRPLTKRQRWTLGALRESTDMESALHESGDANVAGLVARGSTIASLVRRGLAEHAGFCNELDGDGFTIREHVSYYAITAEGRALLATKGASDV